MVQMIILWNRYIAYYPLLILTSTGSYHDNGIIMDNFTFIFIFSRQVVVMPTKQHLLKAYQVNDNQ